MKKKKYDFSGYATKNNVKCSDGRTIKPDAFKHNDGMTVPLVWQHLHDDPTNVLGHAMLENKHDGVYAFCTFNDTEKGKSAKELVKHGDITSLSIFANKLKQQGQDVIHGAIREVSLVLSGANPGALIDNIAIAHSSGHNVISEEEAIIFMDEKISTEIVEHGDDGKTMLEVFDTLNEEQKNVVYAMLAQGLEHGDSDEEDDAGAGEAVITHTDPKGGNIMKKNVFDKSQNPKTEAATLTHSQLTTIVDNAKKCGSFKEAFMAHAQTYGIENIDILFPDAKTVTPTPDFIKRDTEWVGSIIHGTKHSPFSRIKSTAADVTAEEARALGYVKGKKKKEEVIKLLKRVTTPTTIYKKQKLDRDDLIDITDLDVVTWLKSEMRMMLDEELARAILVGDGRDVDSEDKINEEHIRPIYTDDDMYAHHLFIDGDATVENILEEIVLARTHYKGSGNPRMYTVTNMIPRMLLLKDKMGRRIYNNVTDLKDFLRVSDITEVPVMTNMSRLVSPTEGAPEEQANLIAILVNPKDYVVGADKGGNVSMFDDFDIDYNQYKYLIETRCSGALIHPKSALVIEQLVAKDGLYDGESVED